MNWFSTYPFGDWDPSEGFNEYFKTNVMEPLKSWFHLKKTRPGVFECDRSNFWIDYQQMRGFHIFARVERLDVRGKEMVNGSNVPMIKFRLKVARTSETAGVIGTIRKIFKAVFQTSGGEEKDVNLSTFFDEEVKMVLMNDPKQELPLFKILNSAYQYDVSHSHHQLSGSWLCILPDAEMRQGRDTVISGIGAAIDWILWHEINYGNLMLASLIK